jgi:hypothetical protein
MAGAAMDAKLAGHGAEPAFVLPGCKKIGGIPVNRCYRKINKIIVIIKLLGILSGNKFCKKYRYNFFYFPLY